MWKITIAFILLSISESQANPLDSCNHEFPIVKWSTGEVDWPMTNVIAIQKCIFSRIKSINDLLNPPKQDKGSECIEKTWTRPLIECLKHCKDSKDYLGNYAKTCPLEIQDLLEKDLKPILNDLKSFEEILEITKNLYSILSQAKAELWN